MPPESHTKIATKPIANKSSTILDDTPLFAGLEGYVQVQTVKKKEEPSKAKMAKKKKLSVAATDQAKPKRAPKIQKTRPLDPDAILLSVTEMCTLLKISRATLVRMDKSGKLPGRVKLGGSVRFHRATVETWLQSLIIRPSSP